MTQTINDLTILAKNIRKAIVHMHRRSRTSHIGSSLSCVDILVALYFKVLNINPKNPRDPKRDRFILSKGHAASALYATLAERGFFPKDVLDGYCQDSGMLPGHITMHNVPGVEVSTGSLGHGLSIGVGMALAANYDRRPSRIFVVLSDGECNEGSVWEAAMFSAQHKLDRLTVVIDYNKWQAFGKIKDVMDLEPFKEKWLSFGWAVREIDGHNLKELNSAFQKVPFSKGRPSLIIAHTIKGKGVSFMEDKLEWHYKSPTEEQYVQAIGELENQ